MTSAAVQRRMLRYYFIDVLVCICRWRFEPMREPNNEGYARSPLISKRVLRE